MSVAFCLLIECEWKSGEQPVRVIAETLSVWHVYEVHRDVWRSLTGSDRAPHDPDPRIPEIRAAIIRDAILQERFTPRW
jgi:hypothetical protein